MKGREKIPVIVLNTGKAFCQNRKQGETGARSANVLDISKINKYYLHFDNIYAILTETSAEHRVRGAPVGRF